VLTGRGADIIIIDDPLKPEEALSQAPRQAAGWRFADRAARTVIGDGKEIGPPSAMVTSRGRRISSSRHIKRLENHRAISASTPSLGGRSAKLVDREVPHPDLHSPISKIVAH
jgi:hypothetical protein